MSGDRPRFARSRESRPGPDLRVLAALFVVAAGAFAAWELSGRSDNAEPERVAVQVEGDVPSPGIHVLAGPARTADALLAAGRPLTGVEDRPLRNGDLLRVTGDSLQWGTVEDGLVYGLPIDINTAGVAALEAVPGIGARTARRIVEDRRGNGPFDSVDALVRVKGVGPASVEKLRPFLRASAALAPPAD